MISVKQLFPPNPAFLMSVYSFIRCCRLAIESIVAARDRVPRQSFSAEDHEDDTRRLVAAVFEFPNKDELPQPPRYDKTKVKYSCPNCNLNVWGKPDLALICGVCGAAYVSTVQSAKLFKEGNS